MTARCIPASPSFASKAEERVWTALRSQLPEDAALLANLTFVGKDGDWEADLVVVLPEQGTVVIEVKGGHVYRTAGDWWQRTPDGDKRVDPVEQAHSGKYLLRRFLEKRGMRRTRIAHMVALPDTDWTADLDAPDLPRDRTITRETLDDAAGRVRDVLGTYLADEPHRRPDTAEVETMLDLLGGRLTPQRDVAMWQQTRGEHVERLTAEQARYLDLLRDVPRLEVAGGPGSGKTWLALEQTRRLATDGLRVALLCYSKGLASWLTRTVATWDGGVASRVTVGSYHSLGTSWGVTVPEDADQAWWDDECPRLMEELALALPDDQRLDAIVVDEAQDFGDHWWPALLAATQDVETARVVLFRDDQQALFGRTGRPPGITLVPVHLKENVRNVQEVAALFQPLRTGERMAVRGGTGPGVRFVATDVDAVYDVAEEESHRLLDAGWEARDIAVLTTCSRHPVHRAWQEHDGRDGYWAAFWEDVRDEVFYCTVAGFKGLERPAVVLAVDGFRDGADARDVLLVGLSRARDLLVVVGDLDQIEAVAGKEVAKRLRRAGTVPVSPRTT